MSSTIRSSSGDFGESPGEGRKADRERPGAVEGRLGSHQVQRGLATPCHDDALPAPDPLDQLGEVALHLRYAQGLCHEDIMTPTSTTRPRA